MTLDTIAEILKQTTGMDRDCVGHSTIANAVERRMRARNIDDSRTYLERLRDDDDELKELIEIAVVPETWFFRDGAPFKRLCRHVLDEWLPRRHEEPLRILSLPCSTGEEPYSIAMALKGMGRAGLRFHIDAVDISTVAVERAREAVYGKNSFRGKDLAFRDRFFHQHDKRYRLNEEIRCNVRFHAGNLFAKSSRWGHEIYDVIFCRNLLIYFASKTQVRAFEILDQLLKPDGILFLGHAETPNMAEGRFVRTGSPRDYAFCKPQKTESETAQPTANPPADVAQAQPRPRPAQSAPRPFGDVVPLPPKGAAPQEEPLARIRALADAGRLQQALAECQAHLEASPTCESAHHLAGVVCDALGDLESAEQHLRKALYLAPDHYDALVHLSLLLQRRGDIAGAQRTKQRAERVAQRQALQSG